MILLRGLGRGGPIITNGLGKGFLVAQVQPQPQPQPSGGIRPRKPRALLPLALPRTYGYVAREVIEFVESATTQIVPARLSGRTVVPVIAERKVYRAHTDKDPALAGFIDVTVTKFISRKHIERAELETLELMMMVTKIND